jgi:beta-phosphoglucomutase-like phosphatase (HAD superfamily)
MLKAVIFDMDGIIIDSEPIYHKVEMNMFKELGLDLTDEHRYMYVGIRTVDMWQELKQKYDIEFSVEELVELEAKRVKKDMESQNKIKPIAGIKELLEELRNTNIKIALASSSSIRDIETVLNKTGLKEYFTVIVSGDHVENGKPAPDIFELTVSQLNNITDKITKITTETSFTLPLSCNNCLNFCMLKSMFSKFSYTIIIINLLVFHSLILPAKFLILHVNHYINNSIFIIKH